MADPLVYGRIRPEQSSLIGMSIVFGIGAFGSTGVILGPLLTTVTLTLCNIYVEYVTAPLPQHSRLSGTGGTGGSGSESVRLSTAPGLDKQWTGDGFPTFFHAAAETPAAALRQAVHFAPTARTAERGVLHRAQPQLLPPLEPPSPLSWQSNPLGQSKPPSTTASALSSPVAITQPLASSSKLFVPSALPSAIDEKSTEAEHPLQDKGAVTDAKRFLSEPAKGRSQLSLDPTGVSLQTAQPLNAPSHSLHSQQLSAATLTDTGAATSTASSNASSSVGRPPAVLRPLRTKEEEDDPSAVPAAVFIHESDDEGPDSGFDLSAAVVDSQRERKQRVTVVPRTTRARKKTSEGAQ